MQLEVELACLNTFPRPESLSVFEQSLDPQWIEEALRATGKATVRRRRLDATQVVWLVIGMALFRNRPITEVVNKLNLALPRSGKDVLPAPSSIAQARQRVGDTPLSELFSRCGDAWGHTQAAAHPFRGLALYGIDGTTFRVADSAENRKAFGKAKGQRGSSGYPLARLVALMALRSHVLCNVSFGPYEQGEHTYAANLWDAVPDNALVILDKGFLSAALLLRLQQGKLNRHWLLPAKSNMRMTHVKRLAKNDALVELTVSKHARAAHPDLPQTWTVRAIRYQRKGFRPRTLLTSLCDPIAYPASEIVTLYHERWEIELGYGEIKTDMMNQTHTPLRSKTATGTHQELWGLLLAYNLVRLEMARIAQESGARPTQISFMAVYRMICDEWLWCAIASPGAIPKKLNDLRAQIKLFLLPPRRSTRKYPRAVKIKMSNYPRKRP